MVWQNKRDGKGEKNKKIKGVKTRRGTGLPGQFLSFGGRNVDIAFVSF